MNFRLSLGALVVGMLLIPAAPAVTATPTWSAARGAMKANGRVSSVSCVSPTSCHAVGTLGGTTTTNKAFAESWDGTKWSVAPSPSPKGSWLLGVSCVAADWCQAVGWAKNMGYALTMHWDGKAWAEVPNPKQATLLTTLYSVSCVSRAWCVAVGSDFNLETGVHRPLIESWNGKVWSVVPSPRPADVFNPLYGVSCTSRTSCTAVGGHQLPIDGRPSRTLVEQWNGKVWKIVPSPNPQIYGYQVLTSVSCVSASSCVAVGWSRLGTLIESWNGKVWKMVPDPVNDVTSRLASVSCTSPTSCKAVGYTNVNLIESWNGHAWSVTPSANPVEGYNYLLGVSCPSAVFCKAVGDGNFVFTYK